MPVARYFLFVGGVLLALLFVVSAIVPQEAVVATQGLSSPGVDNKTVVRIKSTQKLPERVVYDTNLPTIVPAQVNAVAAATPPAAGDASAQARVRNTFAQFIPPEKADAQKGAVVAEAKPAEQPAQAQPQAPKKRKVARYHSHPQQPMRLAQPGMYQPYRVAQQQPRMGFFGGFGTW
ncbi:hypothetical protein [Bradyrhizobium sp. CCBAU 53421]|uniref:hypothetical protein n=1 Tax=Bradyrhizobium sp. CCBAU 53421 TaxID=1325120 RepID=UPI00188A9AA5|nr:hypothetical protein [Bradyrhizobium sp. CCBAU 53421]